MFSSDIVILVVDDMATGRGQVKKLCKDLGFSHFLDAANGKVALEVLNNNKVDLILSVQGGATYRILMLDH